MRLRICSLMLLLLASAARAGDEVPPEVEQRARELYENGVTLYAEGHFEEAAVAFTEANRLRPHPALLYNIANAQEKAGRLREALATLNL